ncbi:MAG: cytochrome c oxidase subunit II [Chloroflexi bacterium]|nr:cytochrome c oxidase subunit II [Chloroflexota bacterium]
MRRLLLAVPLAFAALSLPSPAAAQPWPVAPSSDGAEQISQLFWFTLVLATIVFILVEGLLIYSSLRFRRRTPLPTQEPPQIHGNTRLEVMWATVPALILIGLFGITVTRLGELSQIPTDPNLMHISVTGRQFSWEFGYGNSGVKTTNDLHLPTGQQIVFDVTAVDVIHGFWVPDLFGQIDANPGRINHITFTANQVGEFRGVCAMLCGAGHSGMLFRVTTQAPADFQTWLQQQQSGAAAPAAPVPNPAASPSAAPVVPAPAASPGVQPSVLPAVSPAPVPGAPAPANPPQPAPGGGDPAVGAQLIQQKGCGGCHTIPNIPGANGTIGPNLAGVASRNRIAGGAVPNNGPNDLKAWIMNPPGLKPGTIMPNLGLTDQEATNIVAYLETLK